MDSSEPAFASDENISFADDQWMHQANSLDGLDKFLERRRVELTPLAVVGDF
jgi:hypothetical protein